MARQIALVEDDDVIRANYGDLLRRAGFSVQPYGTKQEAIEGILREPPELVLLDITLNGERDAGFDVCLEIRKRWPTVPIVFLTSHDGEIDKISGLRLGADDYITKDVSLDYLVVRIETLFKRRDALGSVTNVTQRSYNQSLPEKIGVVVDDATSVASWRGERLNLPLTQFWILRDLCRNPGHPRSHDELMRAAKITVEPNTITAHVKAIRDEFRRVDPSFDQLKTERGRGYRWIPL